MENNTSTILKANSPNEIISKEEYERRVREIVKCKRDIVYFANTYFKILSMKDGIRTIKLYPKQEELLKFFKDEKRAITLSARQSGKSSMYTIYLLWLCNFFPEKKAMLLANKAATAIELVGRIQLAYEYLPTWLKSKIVIWNKGQLMFSNRSEIRAFSSSSDAARGFSCNCVVGNTMVTVMTDNEDIFYLEISKIANLSKSVNTNRIDELTMEKKYNFVYRTTNLVNGKEYIGVHSTDNLNDGYIGSGKRLAIAIRKYGIENFKREILEFFSSRNSAFEREAELVNEEYRNDPNTYNLNLGGDIAPCLPGELNGFYGKHHTEESKEKMKKGQAKYWATHESSLKDYNFYEDDDVIIDGIRYNSFSDAIHKLNLTSLPMTQLLLKDGNGFVDSNRQEQLKKDYEVYLKEKEIRHQHHLEAMRIAAQNPERRRKISESLTGKSHWWQDKINKNPEKIRKMAEKHRGMKRSETAKRNMSEGRKRFFASGGTAPNKGTIAIVNLISGEWKYIPKEQEIPEGWKRGMKL